ncbi:haloalkane dehalogenase [Flexibacterium corallicola]|uniref:haloalkane dehalogenase n=1 Tax=Flexibacterium corallicola TaxID=3037259 RepID=UPI00286EFFB7|nr:haloalkane dehalogenase [Pseudovibrio sp. M1P-2-3]
MNRRNLMKSAITAVALLALPVSVSAGSNEPMDKTYRSIEGHKMAYVDQGSGRPVVFLHGNPTSSYLWRNIIPYVTDNYRAIAPDMIGMGDSGKPNIDYDYEDQRAHLFGLLDSLDLQDAVLVIHDWGSTLGMEYARTRPERVSGIVFMESMLPPFFPVASMDDFGPHKEFMQAVRSKEMAEELVLNQNVFIEQALAKQAVFTPLSEEVLNEYRRPFPTPESRKPILQWPREIPVAGEPANVYEVIKANGDYVLESDIPKLLLYATPGAINPKPIVDFLEGNMKNLETVGVGPGVHYIQEDQPDAIGQSIAKWLKALDDKQS